jgi:chromosome segregation ATPase
VQDARDDMMNKLSSIIDEISRLKAALAARDKDYARHLKVAAEREAALNERVATMGGENESLMKLMQELLATKQRAETGHQSTLAALNKELAALREQAGQLCAKCKGRLDASPPQPPVDKEIDTSAHDALVREVSVLQTQLADAKAELKTRVDRFAAEKKSLEDTVSALLEEQSAVLAEQTNMSERVQQLEQQELKAIELSIQQEDEYEMMKFELEELRKAGKQEEVAQKEKEMKLKKPQSKSTDSISSLKQTIRHLTGQRDTLASEVESLKAKLASIGYVDAEAMKGVPVNDSLSQNISSYLTKMGSTLSLTRVAPGRYRSHDGKEHHIRELRGVCAY